MLHAMNIPAYSPRFAWVQTDLTYLREYRWYVERYNLGTWNDYICWGFTLFLGTFSLVLFVRYLRYSEDKKLFERSQSTPQGMMCQ